MSFGESISTCLRKYATFDGRARRSEFWWFFLFGCLLTAAASVVDEASGVPSDSSGPVAGLVGLALLLPSLAVGARRLHDIDRSGWNQLYVLIPIAGLVMLAIWLSKDGALQANQHGAPVKAHAAAGSPQSG